MAIRITGMYSGLDTEAIISELVSAQSVKKSKYVKEQTKLSWKMDAWKALNTKIYNFYTNTLDNMRFQASYLKKAAKVSNSSALSVVLGKDAVNGTQNVTVDTLATTGKLTGRDLSKDFGNITSSSKLSDLGIEGDASFDVTVGGKKTTIKVNGDMKISDVVNKLKSAGLNASFDNDNHRFFISSKESGAAADFSITANNASSLDALEALGLLTKLSDNEEDPIRKEYQRWADYHEGKYADEYQSLIDAEVAKRAAAYKQADDELKAQNKKLQEEIAELEESENYTKAGGASADLDKLYDAVYGELTDSEDTDDDGNPIKVRTGGAQQDLDAAKEGLKTAKEELEAAKKALADFNATGVEDADEKKKLEDAITDAEGAVNTAQEAVDTAQEAFDDKKAQYDTIKSIKDKNEQITANNEQITEHSDYYRTETETDDEGNEIVTVVAKQKLKDEVKAEFDAKAENAAKVIDGTAFDANTKYADRVEGTDAVIIVDGATFTSSSNDFTVNGMSITVYEKADNVTITTSNDVDGVYDMIKNFFTEYNSLINEMSALYNADSAKGYDPLTSEEKADMADSEIEEWEKKIKDSLLRRDATLGDLTDAIKSVMLQGATVNGKKMYLSDFGINTLGYWSAGENEKGAYHIDGDPDDANVKSEEDKLRKMISSDPDTVMGFFSGLMNNLYDKLSDKMTSIKDTRSMFTVYNDKAMQKEYENYKDKIAKEEEKLNSLMDKWYEKFSRMETALAKLQSKSNGLGNMLGGQ